MKKGICMMTAGLMLWLLAPHSAYAVVEWEKVMSKDNIDIYTSSVSGSPLRECKGETLYPS